MKRYVILLLIIVFYSCCQKEQPINTYTITIDYNQVKKELLSKYFTLYKICPLETTDQNIIGEIKKIEIYNGNIYILDVINNCVFQHDTTGKYIRQLNKIGRGPEEYMRLTDMKVNKQGIFLVDYTQQSIMQYDHDFNFIKKIRMNNCFPFEIQFAEDNLFVYSERTNANNDYCFYEIDSIGNTIYSFVKREKLTGERYNYQNSNVFCVNSDSLFSPRFSNYIYSRTTKDFAYKLDFRDKTFPEEKLAIENFDIGSSQFPFITRENIYQHDNHLFISYNYKKRYFVDFDMNKKQIVFNGELVNDLLPEFRFFPRFQVGEYWIDGVESYILTEYFPKIQTSFDSIQQLKETDNPVLFIYKIK